MKAHKNWRELFDKVEFYRVDIQLLRDLGHEVVLSGGWQTLDWSADLYYCWWWGHSYFPLLPAKLRNRPLVVTGAFDYSTCQGEVPGLCYHDRPMWQRLALKAALRLADDNLFISKFEYDDVVNNLKVKNPTCIPLAVDTDFYKPAENYNVNKSNYFFTMCWTSKTNVARKGLLETLEAFYYVCKKDDKVRLLIGGKPGDSQAFLKEKLLKYGILDRVDFLGMISAEEKRSHYQKCIGYVQPTLYEGFGHAIAEALSCGAPLVISSRGATTEVAGEYAIWVEPRNIESIKQGMFECLTDKSANFSDPSDRHLWVKNNFSFNARRTALKEVISNY